MINFWHLNFYLPYSIILSMCCIVDVLVNGWTAFIYHIFCNRWPPKALYNIASQSPIQTFSSGLSKGVSGGVWLSVCPGPSLFVYSVRVTCAEMYKVLETQTWVKVQVLYKKSYLSRSWSVLYTPHLSGSTKIFKMFCT